METHRKAVPGNRLSQHYSEGEMACPCCRMLLINPELITKLEDLRKLAARPVLVTSGYRCQTRNRKVGGRENSYHLKGMAADIRIPGLNQDKAADLGKQAGFNGIGIYQRHVHLDIRDKPARWRG